MAKPQIIENISNIDTQLIQKPNEISGLDGTLDLTGGQIKFPATQSASSDPNTLDDYEEGIWTPTTSTPNLTISINDTSYTKIGNMVFAKCYIVIENTSGSTIKSYNIFGLPFFSSGYGFATSYFQGTQTNQYIETYGNYSNWQQDLSVGSNLRMYQFVYNTF